MKPVYAAIAAIAGLALLPEPTPAAIFQFQTEGNLPGSKRAGKTTEIFTRYDTESELFEWSSTFTPNDKGVLPEGAWLVVNDGPNPKGVSGELAIAYLDESANKVSLFEYNGLNKADSYLDPGNFLASTALNTTRTADSVTYDFSFDATEINSLDLGPNWKGVQFDDEIGIWFHGVSGLETQYKPSMHELVYFNYEKQSWYDVAHKDTEKIPEPSALLGLGLIGVLGICAARTK